MYTCTFKLNIMNPGGIEHSKTKCDSFEYNFSRYVKRVNGAIVYSPRKYESEGHVFSQ